MVRQFARTFAAAFAATLVLTGCERAETPAEPAPEPPAAEAPAMRWESIASGEGTALMLLGEGDAQLFHLACLSQPARMTVQVPAFRVVGSEERLTLGVDDEAFGFVADTMSDQPGVRAEAAIDPEFLRRLPLSDDIGAMYGSQQAGPFPAPPDDLTEGFVTACRDIAAGGVGA